MRHQSIAILGASAIGGIAFGQPTIVPLGFLPGGEFSHAAGLSSDGRVVVGWGGSTSGMTAFRWGSLSGMQPLPALPGATASFARCVSDNGGVICGWSIIGDQPVATVWTGPQLAPMALGVLPGGRWSQALAVSEDGVTVYGQGDATDGQHALVWTAQSGLRALPDPGAGRAFVALAASGASAAGLVETVGSQGVRWEGATAPALLEMPDNAVGSLVFDIDAQGRIYGSSTSMVGIEPPVRWSGVADEVLALPSNYANGYVQAASPGGTLLAGRAYGSSFYDVFLAGSAVGGTKVLANYLVQVNVPTQGFQFDSATAVSSDAKVIVGTGWRSERREAWMLRLAGAAPLCTADLGGAGGVVGADGRLDNNDFIAFISLFFLSDARADVGVAGGFAGHDGRYDSNDFIAFIDQFFAGCP